MSSFSPFAFAVFIYYDKVDFTLGIIMAAGQGLGAWLGAGSVLKRGSQLIRVSLAIVIALTAWKLLAS